MSNLSFVGRTHCWLTLEIIELKLLVQLLRKTKSFSLESHLCNDFKMETLEPNQSFRLVL